MSAEAELTHREPPDERKFYLPFDEDDPDAVEQAQCHAEKLVEIDDEYRTRQSTNSRSSRTGLPTIVRGSSSTASDNPFPVLPDFQIQSILGQGGKGVVYRAQQLSIQRTVAIKTIRQGGIGSANDIERLRNEARVLGNLRHPNLVTVYSFEEHEGRFYLVMEYISGRDLSFHQRERLLTAREAAAHVLTAAEAVEAAHQCNVLHRDIKPSNILLDDDGNIRVTDFGLSRQLVASDTLDQLTATSEILGTPGYISPEQAQGFSRNLDATTDVYGIGSTLYALLTGIAPFSGSDVLAILQQVRERQPTPVRMLQPMVPVDLQTICMKCLEKRPSDRYESAQLLADDLRRFLNGESIHARPIPIVLQGVRWCRRNPVLTGLMSAVAVLILMTVGLVISRSIDNANILAVTTAQNEELERALHREQAANEQLENSLEREQAATAEVYDNTIRLARLEYEANEVDNALRLLESLRKRYSVSGAMAWEWNYLWGLIHSSPQTWKMPLPDADWIGATAFSPDGRLVALSNMPPRFDNTKFDQRGRVTIREVDSDHVVQQLTDVLAVHDLMFSDDGSMLLGIESAFGRKDGEIVQRSCKIRRWQTDDWSELPGIETGCYFERATFNEDGTLLLTLGIPLPEDPVKYTGQVGNGRRELVVVDLAVAKTTHYRHWIGQPDKAGLAAVLEDGTLKQFAVSRPRSQMCSAPQYPDAHYCGRTIMVSVNREAFGPDKVDVLVRRRPQTGRQQAEAVLEKLAEVSFAQWPVAFTAITNLNVKDAKNQRPWLSRAMHHCSSTLMPLLVRHPEPNKTWPLVRSIALPTLDAFAVDPTETYLAVATDAGEIRVWNIETWQQQPARRDHMARIRSLEFSDDGHRLVSGDWNGTVHVWDINRPPGVVDTMSPMRGNRVEAFARDESSRHLAAVFIQTLNPEAPPIPTPPLQRVRVGQRAAEQAIHVPLPEKFRSAGRTIAMSPDGKFVAVPSTEDDALLNVIDASSGEVVKSLPHRARVSLVQFFGDRIASAAWRSGYFGPAAPEDGEIRLSDQNGTALFSAFIPETRIYRVAVSSDGKLIAASCQQYRSEHDLPCFVRVWTVADGTQVDEFEMPSWTMGLAFEPESRLLAALSFNEGAFVLRDVSQRTTVQARDRLKDQVQDLHFTSAGRRMVTASRREVVFWNTDTWRRVLDLELEVFAADYVFNPQLKFYDDGHTILANQANGTIRMWQIPDVAQTARK